MMGEAWSHKIPKRFSTYTSVSVPIWLSELYFDAECSYAKVHEMPFELIFNRDLCQQV